MSIQPTEDGGWGVSLPDRQFQSFLREGRVMLPRAKSSGRYVFYPRVFEPGTGDELTWVQACGHGVVYSVTVVRPKPPAFPYNVALIELDEGPRLMSRVDSIDPEQVKIGMRVRARIVTGEDIPYLAFVPDVP